MLDIRYEDEALLVVNKPPGILIHPTTTEDENSLATLIKNYYQERGWILNLHPVSRLDRYTSGLVVFAKFPEIQGMLIKQGMQKEYLALVTGTLPADHGIIDTPIARKPGSIIEREVNPDGKPCKTEYWVIANHVISNKTDRKVNKNLCDTGLLRLSPQIREHASNNSGEPLSLVRCRLYTGRTHQIRVHFASIGCPLWHDNLYGKIPGPPQRHGLHSYKLSFIHPWTGVKLEVISMLPGDMTAAWDGKFSDSDSYDY